MERQKFHLCVTPLFNTNWGYQNSESLEGLIEIEANRNFRIGETYFPSEENLTKIIDSVKKLALDSEKVLSIKDIKKLNSCISWFFKRIHEDGELYTSNSLARKMKGYFCTITKECFIIKDIVYQESNYLDKGSTILVLGWGED